MLHLGSLVAAWKLLVASCGIQFPNQGLNLAPHNGSMESEPLDSGVSDKKLVGTAREGWFCCPQEVVSTYIYEFTHQKESIIFADNDVQHLKLYSQTQFSKNLDLT